MWRVPLQESGVGKELVVVWRTFSNMIVFETVFQRVVG